MCDRSAFRFFVVSEKRYNKRKDRTEYGTEVGIAEIPLKFGLGKALSCTVL